MWGVQEEPTALLPPVTTGLSTPPAPDSTWKSLSKQPFLTASLGRM